MQIKQYIILFEILNCNINVLYCIVAFIRGGFNLAIFAALALN